MSLENGKIYGKTKVFDWEEKKVKSWWTFLSKKYRHNFSPLAFSISVHFLQLQALQNTMHFLVFQENISLRATVSAKEIFQDFWMKFLHGATLWDTIFAESVQSCPNSSLQASSTVLLARAGNCSAALLCKSRHEMANSIFSEYITKVHHFALLLQKRLCQDDRLFAQVEIE